MPRRSAEPPNSASAPGAPPLNRMLSDAVMPAIIASVHFSHFALRER
jgi:hypothetical protein